MPTPVPRRLHRLARLSALLLAGVAGPLPVLAQSVPPVLSPVLPPSLDPNRLDQRFERPAVPQSKPEIEMPAPEKAPPPRDAERITLTLSEIRIDGNSVYDSDSLSALWRDKLGKPITLADLYAIRDAITARYRNDGYVLSQAVVPAQRIRDGVVRLQVVEGYVDEVVVQGEATDRLGLLRRMGRRSRPPVRCAWRIWSAMSCWPMTCPASR